MATDRRIVYKENECKIYTCTYCKRMTVILGLRTVILFIILMSVGVLILVPFWDWS